ncbi:OprD family outer membrane porin [Zooshikella harenae]|uniref:OprD family outer membrane porin n=1 Tax=Zooshikella harenae TaxID=2827238 RepID=A0ABS5Z8B7_9GAMM|nr:OprD family outer membrane porin [Zooshikella harenae]MBU2710289.1 OprD family outer membrane porin [Zooshikella harenae]
MKMFKLSALSAAVFAAASATAVTAQAEGFIDDSSATLSIRNQYRNESGVNGHEFDRKEWVQGFQLDYQSGYFMDIIGFDYSAGAAFKLDQPANETGWDATNLPQDGNRSDVNDIAGTNQAYLKAKFGDENLNANMKFGLQRTCTELFCPSGSRILPASAYGTYLEGNVQNLKVYGARWTQMHSRSQSYFAKDFKDGDNTIDSVKLVGAAYKFDNGLGLYAEYGEADEYLKKYFTKADYTIDLGNETSLLLDARYAHAKDHGDNYNGEDNDYESKYYNLTATLSIQDLDVWVGYNVTKDGDWAGQWDGEVDQAGAFNSSLDLWQGYNRKDERAWVVGVNYKFDNIGLPGLEAGTRYAHSSNIDKNSLAASKQNPLTNDDQAHEWTQWAKYTVQTGPMKDFSVYVEHARGDNPTGGDEDDTLVHLQYDLAIF